MKICVFTKTNDQRSINLAKEFITALPKGVESLLFCSGKEVSEAPIEKLTADIFVCFGGDGSILRCARYAALVGARVFAVNTGNLGFLSALEGSADAKEICKAVLSDEIVYDEKILLEGTVETSGKAEQTFYAFNEIAVSRMAAFGLKSGSVSLDLRINGDFADGYLADGLMIATPAGSTAYSLSAGGAILAPELKGLIATAICPHTLHNRPIVFCDDGVAEITLKYKRGAEKAGVYADGNLVASVSAGERVVIKKSNKSVKIAKGEGFYARLNKKLQYWGKEG